MALTPEQAVEIAGKRPNDPWSKEVLAKYGKPQKTVVEKVAKVVGAPGRFLTGGAGKRIGEAIGQSKTLQKLFIDRNQTPEMQRAQAEIINQSKYEGPSAKQLAGDVVNIGATLGSMAVAAPATALGRVALGTGVGTVLGGSRAAANDESIAKGALIGGTTGLVVSGTIEAAMAAYKHLPERLISRNVRTKNITPGAQENVTETIKNRPLGTVKSQAVRSEKITRGLNEKINSELSKVSFGPAGHERTMEALVRETKVDLLTNAKHALEKNDISPKVFSEIKKVLESNYASLDDLGQAVGGVRSTPVALQETLLRHVAGGKQVAETMGIGDSVVQRGLAKLPNSEYTAAQYIKRLKSLVPNDAGLITKVVKGSAAPIEVNALRSSLDKASRSLYNNPNAPGSAELIGSFADALRETVKGIAPTTVPFFEQLSKEQMVQRALLDLIKKSGGESLISFYDLLAAAAGFFGGPGALGAAGAVAGKRVISNPSVQIGAGQIINRVGGAVGPVAGQAIKGATPGAINKATDLFSSNSY